MKTIRALLFTTFLSIRVVANPVPVTGTLTGPNQKPLAYASVGVVNTPVGTVADEQGRFTLYITDKVKPSDTVRVSLLGYEPLSLTVADFRQRLTTDSTLVLTEQAQTLREVRVLSRDSQAKTLGKKSFGSAMVTNFALSELPRQNLGAEIGRRFNVSNGVNRLEKYSFYILTNYDTVTFRVNVYRLKGWQSLLKQNVYVTVVGKGRKWVDVDLTPYQLITSDDVVVSIQWVDNSAQGSAIQLPIHMPAPATHYYKYGSQDRWKKFPGMTTTMNLTVTRSAGTTTL